MSLFRQKWKSGAVAVPDVVPAKDGRSFRVDLSFSSQVGQAAQGGLSQQDAAVLLNQAVDMIESLRARCDAAEQRTDVYERERRDIIASAEAEIGRRDRDLAAMAVRSKALEEALERVSSHAWQLSRTLDTTQAQAEEWATQLQNQAAQITYDKSQDPEKPSGSMSIVSVDDLQKIASQKDVAIAELTQSCTAAQARVDFLEWRLNGFEDLNRLRREIGDPVSKAA